jgi:predicted RND superfamily exporter protein
LAMMAGLFLFLWLVWKRALYAILTSGLALYTLLVIGALVSLLASEPLSVWLLIVPMGLIIDDAIHFFVRYLRAKQGFFQSSEQAVRFTMASIGRPIWVTSLVLLVGVSVLTTSSNPLIRLESWVVVASLLLMTFFVLVLVPALLMKSHK